MAATRLAKNRLRALKFIQGRIVKKSGVLDTPSSDAYNESAITTPESKMQRIGMTHSLPKTAIRAFPMTRTMSPGSAPNNFMTIIEMIVAAIRPGMLGFIFVYAVRWLVLDVHGAPIGRQEKCCGIATVEPLIPKSACYGDSDEWQVHWRSKW
jgi:hypothetical protein